MAWLVTVSSATGSDEMRLGDDWMPPSDQPPTALDVGAHVTGEMAARHRACGGSPTLGFRPPLTITIEEA